jgi:5-methylcytosine-specific restriction endonuclease McrA
VARLSRDLRYKILESDQFLCRFCGIGGRNSDIILEVHHIKWRRHGGSDEPANLMTVCRACHNVLHYGYVPSDIPLTFTELRKRGGWGSY